MVTVNEIKRLELFIDLYATHVMKIDPKSRSHPSNAKKEIIEKFGEKKANSGLKMAVNDIVNDSLDLHYSDVKKIDEFLIENNSMSLSQARKEFMARYKKILKNGKIKGEKEYFIVKGIADGANVDISDSEKELLFSMISEYEKA